VSHNSNRRTTRGRKRRGFQSPWSTRAIVLRETSPETHRRGQSLRQIRRKTSLQTHRRRRTCASLDAIASFCAAGRRTRRQFTPLQDGQGLNLRRSRVDRAAICVEPESPSRRLPARNGRLLLYSQNERLDLTRCPQESCVPRPAATGRSMARGAEKKGKFAIQKAYRKPRQQGRAGQGRAGQGGHDGKSCRSYRSSPGSIIR
jgi:hypothetical protein